MKVLIVDNDQISRRRVTSTLKETNYQVIECSSGQEALNALNQPDPPKLIILDWMLPGMDGLSLCKSIRSGSNLLTTYLIMLTAKNDEKNVQEGYKAGINDYVRKPFITQELLARVNVGSQMLGLQSIVTKQNAQLFHSYKLAAIGEMAANIAHEINNPLTVINGYAQQAKSIASISTPKNERLQKCHEKILTTSKRIDRTIKNLLTLSRSSSDGFENVKVSKIIESSLELCEHKLKYQNIHLTVAPFDTGLMIEGKESNLSQVLINLISNAQQAIEELDEKWIKLTVSETDDSIVLKVIDSGTGIYKSIRNKLMDPFFTTKENSKGTGLGLSISKNIILDHFGDFYIEETSKNTCFVIRLPKMQTGITIKERRSIKILIVEDEVEIRDLLIEEVKSSGVQVFEASDGNEALEILKEHQIDIVLSDINMPRMDGIQLMSSLRKDASNNGVIKPLLLFMTGYGKMALKPEKLKTLGVQELFEKTEVVIQIKRIISNYCRVEKSSTIAA